MTNDEAQYYDDLGDMMGSAGWRRLVEEARKQIYQFQAEALEAKTIEQVFWLRGQAEQLARIIDLKDTLAALKANAVEEAEDAPL